MQFSTLLATAVLAAAGVQSHATLQYINDNSAVVRPPPNNNPIQDVNDANLSCNYNGNVPRPSKLTVAAGSSVTLEWHHGGRDTQAIDPSHKGPISTYMAKVNDATKETNPGSLNWFKIYEDGLTISGSQQTWAVDKLIANNGKYQSTIPRSIPSGDYLIRSEIIALHAAGSSNGAQFYQGCAQITVTGGGNANPATVKLPGAYKQNDPGVLVNIYYPPLTSYQIPGPRPFTG